MEEINPRAFPRQLDGDELNISPTQYGMTLRDWFAGQALASGTVQSSYPEWQLRAWFGGRTGLSREEITARAVYEIADAMLATRKAQQN